MTVLGDQSRRRLFGSRAASPDARSLALRTGLAAGVPLSEAEQYEQRGCERSRSYERT